MLFCANYPRLVKRLFLAASLGASGYPCFAVDKQGQKIQLKANKEMVKALKLKRC